MQTEDPLLAELQQVNKDIVRYKGLLKEDKAALMQQLRVASEDTENQREACFVQLNGRRVLGTRRLERLLQLESVYDKLVLLGDKDPCRELERCLERKIRLLQTIGGIEPMLT